MAARHSLRIFALLVIVALVFAGCGKNEADEPTPAAPTSQPATAAPSAPQGDASKGEQVFQTACAACHGPEAMGIQGLGKSLHPTDSEFVDDHSDDELVEFIKVGRQPDDPLNTTGIAMPPKGGNPAISDDDMYNIVAWLRTLE